MQIRSRIKEKKFFLKLFITIAVLCMVIVMTISTFFSNLFISNMVRQLTVDNLKSLERLNDDLDGQFKQLHQLYLFLVQNYDVYEYLNADTYDSDAASRSRIHLKLVRGMNSYLYSVYLYNRQCDDYLLAGESQIEIAQFTSHPLNPVDADSSLRAVFSTITPRQLYSDNSPPFPTISLLYSPEKNTESSGINSSVIMNLDSRKVNKDLIGKFDGLTIVADNSGNVVFNSFNYEIERNIRNTSYYQKIQADFHDKGSFQLNIDKEDKLVSFVKSNLSDLYLINVRPISNISQTVNAEKYRFILISILAIVIFCLFGFFISKVLYTPIRRVTELFLNSKYHTGSGDGRSIGEMGLISSVFRETMDHVRELELESEDKSLRLKEEFLRQVLRMEAVQASSAEETQEYRLDIQWENLIPLCVKADNYSHFTGRQRYLFENALIKMVPEFLQENFRCETVNMYDGEIAVLINFKNTQQNDFAQLLSDLVNLKKAVYTTFGITVTVGIGKAVNQLSECRDAYLRAVEMVRHRFILGFDKIIYQKLIDETLLTNLTYPSEIEDSLITSIKLNKKALFAENLNSLCSLLKNYAYPEGAQVFIQIVLSCIKTINQIASQESKRFKLDIDEFGNVFAELQTIEQATEWLLKVFTEYEQLVEELNQLKGNKHFEVITKSQNYIKEKYQDINLSIDVLSDVTGYSPYYFTKIYKEITGINVNDYIRQIRIEKAKELLGTTSRKVNEIPELVGFTNTSYFCSTFKKDVGLTPSAFREYTLRKV